MLKNNKNYLSKRSRRRLVKQYRKTNPRLVTWTLGGRPYYLMRSRYGKVVVVWLGKKNDFSGIIGSFGLFRFIVKQQQAKPIKDLNHTKNVLEYSTWFIGGKPC